MESRGKKVKREKMPEKGKYSLKKNLFTDKICYIYNLDALIEENTPIFGEGNSF